MHRFMVVLIAVGCTLAVTAALFMVADGALKQQAAENEQKTVSGAERQLLIAERLEAMDLATQAAGFAREDEFVQIFAKPDAERIQAAFVAAEARKARLQGQEGAGTPKQVGIIGIVDANGKLLARDLNPNWRNGDDLRKEFPSLGVALTKAQANKDVWNIDGAMYRVGTAPIRGPGGTVTGAVFIGYTQTVQDAREARDLLGTEVLFFVDGKIHSSSFDKKDGSSSESTFEKQIADQLFDGPKLAAPVIAQHQATQPFRLKLGHDEWIAAAAPLPGNATPSASGFVVLQSLSAAQSRTGSLPWLFVALGLVGVLAIVVTQVLTARRFLDPLDKIESGVSEVINGNHEYVFESPSPDFEGLANGLNVMMARLTGRPDPGDDEHEEEVTDSLKAMES